MATISAVDDPRAAFIEAAFWHGSPERADAILAAHPGLAASDIHTAAMLGDAAAVRRFLEADPASATMPSPPLSVDALTHLCFSIYLGRDHDRPDAFVRAARDLLDAGASANTGFYDVAHEPEPEWEPVLYGAAGVAHHAGMTRLLLERGANPNDVEVVYHSPETHDNRAMALLVATGRLTSESLALMLLRKHDWHDYAGVKLLLEAGADVNRPWRGRRAIHQAIVRDNDRAIVELLLDHGADTTLAFDGRSAVEMAARRGRRDLLNLFARRGVPLDLPGVLGLIAACARGDADLDGRLAEQDPLLVDELLARGGTLLAEFAGTGNADGVGHLLDLGVPVNARYGGDPYFGIPEDSTALHVAAWRAWPAVVRRLIGRGADVAARDGAGRTPLALAVLACVDSYWTDRRTPESVEALLGAGASPREAPFPSGYADVDRLLAEWRA